MSVCQSVTLSHDSHIGWVTSNAITRIINLEASLSEAPISVIAYNPKGTPETLQKNCRYQYLRPFVGRLFVIPTWE